MVVGTTENIKEGNEEIREVNHFILFLGITLYILKNSYKHCVCVSMCMQDFRIWKQFFLNTINIFYEIPPPPVLCCAACSDP